MAIIDLSWVQGASGLNLHWFTISFSLQETSHPFPLSVPSKMDSWVQGSPHRVQGGPYTFYPVTPTTNQVKGEEYF